MAADPVVAERFRREAIAVAQLSHPNIVAVYDAIEDTSGDSRRQAVVMQLVNGKSLRQLLDEQTRLSPDLTIHIGSCVAAALDAAHRAGLVHRDVKPGNILITPDGRVLLTDFGIAKGLEATGDDLTSDNIMMGTAKYLSPEQVRGKKLDGRADLYSLGLVLYECLAGRVPFLGETDADTALARLEPRSHRPRPAASDVALRPRRADPRLLARRPMDRFATGAEVRVALTRVATRVDDPTASSTPSPSPAGAPARRPTGQNPVGGRPAARRRRRIPTRASQRPAGRAAARRADRTPTSTTRPRQQPNRTFEQRRGPSLILVGWPARGGPRPRWLLWATLHDNTADGGFSAPSTVVPTSSTDRAGRRAASTIDKRHDATTPRATTARRTTIWSALTIDGNPATVWSTLCYGSRTLGGKGGVGVVADLGTAAIGNVHGRHRQRAVPDPDPHRGRRRDPRADRRLGIAVEACRRRRPRGGHRVDQQADPLRAGDVQAARQDGRVHQESVPRRHPEMNFAAT